jgi:hypothetical protein
VPAAVGHSFRASPGISVTTTTTDASIPARSIAPATEQRPVTAGFRVGGDAPVGEGVRCPGALAESRVSRHESVDLCSSNGSREAARPALRQFLTTAAPPGALGRARP